MGLHRLQNASYGYCPLQFCLKGWRKKHGLCTRESDQHNQCTIANCGRTSNGIVQHIRDFGIKNEPLHELVLLYVKEYYGCTLRGGYLDTKVGHKALYPINSIEYNASIKFEIGINAVEVYKTDQSKKKTNSAAESENPICDMAIFSQATKITSSNNATSSHSKHIPSSISLPSNKDLSTLTKTTTPALPEVALSELTMEELRAELRPI